MIRLDCGTYLVRQGDAPTCAYLIESGSLEVVTETTAGERLLAVLGAGEIVGEMALLDRSPRTASVRARASCLLMPITAESLEKRLAVADPVLRLVLGTMLERFRGMLGVAQPKRAEPPCGAVALRTAAYAELKLEDEFAQALAEGQIQVHYQPIVDLADHSLAGFEALARWMHPVRGMIPPGSFVPVAEASGASGALTRACLGRVARDLTILRARARARHDHVAEPRVSVNLSGHDLMEPGFVEGLAALTLEAGTSPDAVTLELTETTLVRNPSEAALALQAARRLGFKIAVDDFGTGYSTLNYIRTLPVDMLKIDRSFVQGMQDCSTTRSIVASTLALAATLGIAVVGEGVELAEQHALLQMLGCDCGQGFLYGRPAPLTQTLHLIDTWNTTGGVPLEAASIFAPSA